ncbi:MAG: hypothetical protein ABIN55_14135, partial [Aeromicrobium sp.]
RLVGAERDLKHAERTRSYDPLPPKLAAAFTALRSAVPRAHASLAPQLAALDRVDPSDRGAVASAIRDLKAAAGADSDYKDCLGHLEVIAGFELDEE